MLATLTWTGAIDGNWATDNAGLTNWQGNVLPSNGDDLVFPAGAQHLATANNLLTSANSITFQGDFSSGNFYTLSGNALTLGAGGLFDNGTSTSAQAGGNAVGIDLTLGAAQSWTVTNAGYHDTISGTVGLGDLALTYSGKGPLDVSGAVSGTGGAIVVNADVGQLLSAVDQAAGTLELSHQNSYTGGTTITSGRLLATADGALGPGAANDAGTTIADNGQLELSDVAYATAENVTLNGGSLLAVNDNSTTTTFAGALNVPNVTSQGGGNDINSRGSGAVVFTGAVNFSNLDLTIDAGSSGGLSFQNAITGAGQVGMDVTLEAGCALGLNHANQYTGGTFITGGTNADGLADVLTLGADGALPDGPLTITPGFSSLASAALNLNNHNLTVTSLSDPDVPSPHSQSTIELGTATLSFGDSNNTVFAGSISGGGGIVKTGTGTFTLIGKGNYAGLTSIQAGTFENQTSLSGAVSVAAGATFEGLGTVGGDITVAGGATGGTLSPENVDDFGLITPGTLAESGNVTFNAGASYGIELGGNTVFSQLSDSSAAGTVSLNDATLNVSVLAGANIGPGTMFNIVTATTLTGTFAGLPDGTTFKSGGNGYKINYSETGASQKAVLTFLGNQIVWVGADSGLWSDPKNWQLAGNNAVPSDGDQLVFPVTAPHLADNTDDLDALHSVNSIVFAGTGSGAAGYSIVASGLSHPLAIVNGLTDDSSATGTFTNKLLVPLDFTSGPTLDVENTQTELDLGDTTGAGTIIKTGPGTLSVSAVTSTFTGDVNIDDGDLDLNSAAGSFPGQITVDQDAGLVPSLGIATLSGSGPFAGTISVLDGSVLTPGAIHAAGASTMTTSNDVGVQVSDGFATGGTFADSLRTVASAPVANKLVSTGTVDVSTANLVVSSTGGFAVGTKFTLIQAGTLTGTFANAPSEGSVIQAGGQQLAVSYQNNQVTLTVLANVSSDTLTWTGDGTDDKWSDAANWVLTNGTHRVPGAGDDLIFPATAAQLTGDNDITGLSIHSMLLMGLFPALTGYQIAGDAMTIGAGGIVDNSAFDVLSKKGSALNALDMDINLAATQTWANDDFLDKPTTVATRTLTINGAISLGAFNLTVAGEPIVFNGPVSGSGQITDVGSLTLAHANTFTGGIQVTGVSSVTAGFLTVSADQALGPAGSIVTLNGSAGNAAPDIDFEGVNYSTSAAITLNDGILSGASSTFAGTVINNSGSISTGNSTLTLTGPITNNSSLGLVGGNSQAGGLGTLVVNGAISGSGGIDVAAAVLVPFSTGISSVNATLSAVDNYQGPTSIESRSTVVVGAAGALPATSAVQFDSFGQAFLNLNGFNETVASLSTTGGVNALNDGTVELGGASFTAGDATNTTFAGALTGNGGFIKQGTGSLDLTGTNTATGTTEVKAGTLLVDGTTANQDAVSVDNAATLGGVGAIGGAITVAAGGNLSPGSATPGTLATNAVSLSPGSNYVVVLNGTSAGQFDTLSAAGNVNLNDANLVVQTNGSIPQNAALVVLSTSGTLSGTFAQGNSITVGSQTFAISYAGNKVTLTAQNAGIQPGTLTWTGGSTTTSNWSDPANWDLNRAPINGDSLVFPDESVARTTNVNDISGLSLNSIAFQDELSGPTAAPYVISGDAVTIGAGGIVDGVDASSAALHTDQLDLGITLNANQTWSMTTTAPSINTARFETLALGGTVTLGSFNLDLLANTGETNDVFQFNGAIDGAGKLVVDASTGAIVWLTQKDGYTGGTQVNTGTVLVTADGALGPGGASDGGTTLGNGSTNVATEGGLAIDTNYTTPETITINSGVIAGGINPVTASLAPASFAGPITFNSSNGVVDIFLVGEPFTLTGNVTFGNFDLHAINEDATTAAALVLNATIAGGGTLQVLSNVNLGGSTNSGPLTLAGTGSVSGKINVAGGSTLEPGDPNAATKTGTFTNSGNVTFQSTSNFSVQLNGTAAGQIDQLDSSGTVTLGGATLNVSSVGGFAPGTSFVIVKSANPIGGTFNNLAEGATVTAGGQNFTISYANDQVTLTVPGGGPQSSTLTWTGAVDAKWSTAGNWNLSDGTHRAPIDGDSLVFPYNATASNVANNDDIDNLMLNSITFNGNDSTGKLPDYQVSGDALTIGAGGISADVTGNGPAALGTHAPVINNDLTLSAAESFSADDIADLVINGTVNLGSFQLSTVSHTSLSLAEIDLNGAVRGSGSIEVNMASGLGTHLTSQNSYTGGTKVVAGGLFVAADGALGPGSGGTTVDAGGSLTIDHVVYNTPEPLVLNGGGLVGEANSSFAGTINVTDGSASILGVGVGPGAGFTLDGAITFGAFLLNLAGGGVGAGPTGSLPLIVNGTLTGTGSVDLFDVTLNNVDQYPGRTVASGTVTLGNAGALPASTAVTLSPLLGVSAALNINNLNVTIGSLADTTLTGQPANAVQLGSGTLTLGGDNTSTTFGGNIQGTGGVTKQGSGTLDLTGANSYTGTTSVQAGTLLVDGSTAAGSNVVVAAGATLGGAGTVSGVVGVGGTLSPGAGPDPSKDAGRLSTGDVVFTSGSTYAVQLGGSDLSGTETTDQIISSGTVTLSGAQSGATLGKHDLTIVPGATLDLSALAGTVAFGQGSRFFILQGNSVVGTFSNAPNGGTISDGVQDFTVVYTGTNVALDTTAGTASFSAATFNATETDANAAITLTRTGGSSGELAVSVSTSNGTAIAGTDYTATTQTVVWADGDATLKTINIPLLDDNAVGEGTQTVILTLTDTHGFKQTATLNIAEDNDTPIGGVVYLEGQPGDANDATFVHNLYRNLLGREPDPSGQAFWVGLIERGGSQATSTLLGRERAVADIMNSPEYKEHLVLLMYQTLLDRVPEPGGLAFWTEKLGQPGTPDGAAGSSDEKFVLAGIAGSQEYYTLHGGSDQGWINALYQDLLGRAVDAGGLAAWEQQAASQPNDRDGLVRDMLAAPEAEHKLLNAFFPNADPSIPLPGAPAVGPYALADITGGGWENLYFQGNFSSPAASDIFFDELAIGTPWDTIIEQMIDSSQYYDAARVGV